MMGGPVLIPSIGNCVRDNDVINLISHELGHALNLHHDFRDVKYIMAKGGPHRTQFSECSAMLLSVSHLLNKVHNHVNTKGQIEILTPKIYTINHREHKLRFKISDPDKIHQVLLEYIIPNNLAGIADCKPISNKITTEIMYCLPKFGPLPKPRLWYNLHDLKGGPNGETKTKNLHP